MPADGGWSVLGCDKVLEILGNSLLFINRVPLM